MAENKDTVSKVNVYRALQTVRVALQEKDIKKSGHNDYGKYDYFELSDFLPEINKLALENNIICLYEITEKDARLHIADIEDYENRIDFVIPIAELTLKGANAIQNVGGLTTYTRRYLYMIAFEIAENDEFDPNQQVPDAQEEEKKEEINKKTISEKDVNALCNAIQKARVAPEAVLDKYGVNTYNEMSFENFMDAMNILNGMIAKLEAKNKGNK